MDLRAVSILKDAGLTGFVLALLGGAAASAQSSKPDTCFDVSAEAWIVRQTPTPIPDCKDCIVVSWPWRIDFDIRRVWQGQLSRGSLQAQAVQHTYIRDDHAWRVWLRRNELGGFNLVGLGEAGELERCPSDAPPAKAYDNRPG
jgi:hypothetical protein